MIGDNSTAQDYYLTRDSYSTSFKPVFDEVHNYSPNRKGKCALWENLNNKSSRQRINHHCAKYLENAIINFYAVLVHLVKYCPVWVSVLTKTVIGFTKYKYH